MPLTSETGPLTADQASEFNRHYDLCLVTGAHGVVGSGPNDTNDPVMTPTQAEYSAAADVIRSMTPDDTLFIENYGYQEQVYEPAITRLGKLACQESNARDKTLFGEIIAATIAELEGYRRNYKLTVWGYAATLAVLKGISVIAADRNADERRADLTANNGEDVVQELLNNPHVDRTQFNRVNTLRERSASMAVTRWGLQHMHAANQSRHAGEPRQKLVLLFGKHHEQGLGQEFSNMSIDFRLLCLPDSRLEQRVAEYTAYTKLQEAGSIPCVVAHLSAETETTDLSDLTARYCAT